MASTVLPAPARRYSAPRDRVAPACRAAAPALGLRPGTVHQLVHGRAAIHVRLAEIVRAAATLGDVLFIERVLAPIEAARASLPTPVLTPELIQQAQASDAAEEVAETVYHTSPTLPHLRCWLTALERQRADSFLLLVALREEMARA